MEDNIVRAPRRTEKQVLARRMRREMTPAEEALWQRLRANRLLGLHFRRQQVIDGFIADFYCREVRLVIECDGGVHQAQADYDWERDEILARRNLHILRFANREVEQEIETVLAQIALYARQYLAAQEEP